VVVVVALPPQDINKLLPQKSPGVATGAFR